VAWTIFGEFRGDNSELSTLRHLEDEAADEASGASGASGADEAAD
ncbi:MAG: hypothetical protein GY939_18545, partial [Actinomycetia bacterium]|nr:hypothetical protein [Actinomycetes bacterium]